MRSVPVIAVVALLAVVAVGTGYAYTAVFTQDLGTAEITVSYIEVTGVTDTISTDGKVSFTFDKKGVDGDLYMDLEITTSGTGYLKVVLDNKTFFAKIDGGSARFVAIPVTGSGSIAVTLENDDVATGSSVSELVIYSTGGSS